MTFPPDGTRWTVTGVYPQVVAQRENLFSNPFNQFLMAPALEVCSPHGACKERIPCENGTGCMETDTPWRMPWCVDHR